MPKSTYVWIAPAIPADFIKLIDLDVLGWVGISYEINQATPDKLVALRSAQAIDTSDDVSVVINNPQASIDAIDIDYPPKKGPRPLWANAIAMELTIYIQGYGNVPYKGRIVEDENIAFSVLRTIMRRAEMAGYELPHVDIHSVVANPFASIGDTGLFAARVYRDEKPALVFKTRNFLDDVEKLALSNSGNIHVNGAIEDAIDRIDSLVPARI